jgi:hypothetical protein
MNESFVTSLKAGASSYGRTFYEIRVYLTEGWGEVRGVSRYAVSRKLN